MEETKTISQSLIEKMQNGACVHLFSVLGIIPEYTEAQLKHLEIIFKDRYPTFAPQSVLLPFGFYLGETLVRNIKGASWTKLDQNDIFKVEVHIPSPQGDLFAKPFVRFSNYVIDETDTPSALYDLFTMLSKHTYAELTEIGEPLTDGWYKFAGGLIIRLKPLIQK